MDLLTSIVLLFLGLCLGSFAGAQVWRLRAYQLVEDKAVGEDIDKKELKTLSQLVGKHGRDDRSICLRCKHRLAWYDLIPLASWLSTGGKCRYCRAFIGWLEPLIELGTAAVFVASYLLWPEPLQNAATITQFGLWLLALVGLAILFVYDLKWMLLPDKVMLPLGVVASVIAIINIAATSVIDFALLNLLGAVLILSGLYLVLWLISKGRWVGFGDVKLGLVLALLLGDYQLALVALLVANVIGCIVVIIGMALGKISRKNPVPFGPFLIAGAIIAELAGPVIISWYLGIS